MLSSSLVSCIQDQDSQCPKTENGFKIHHFDIPCQGHTQKNQNGHPRVVQWSSNGHPTRSNTPNHRSLTTWSQSRILRILHSLCFHGRPAVAAKTRKGKKRLQRTRGVNQPQICVNVKNCHLVLSENRVGPPNKHFIRKMRINFRILGYRTFRQTHFGVEARAAIRFLTISIQISLPQSHQGSSSSPPAMRKSKGASWYYVLACPSCIQKVWPGSFLFAKAIWKSWGYQCTFPCIGQILIPLSH